MRGALLNFVRHRGGVVTRQEALTRFPVHVIDDALTDAALTRVAPSVYALAADVDRRQVVMAGLLLWRPDAAVSHTDGLWVWSLPTALGERVHLTVPGGRPATEWHRVTLHRRRGFEAAPPQVVVRGGLRVVRVEQAIIESWPMLPAVDRRAPAIVAIRERRTTGARLLDCLASSGRCAGGTEMRRVFSLIGSGLHSPLELWGHEQVFDHPALPIARCQVPVDLRTGRVYLDRLYDEEMVNVELDGAAYHGEPGQRERDLRRDAALAALGFVTLRFSHQRLHADPDGVRKQLLDVLQVRRRQLGLAIA